MSPPPRLSAPWRSPSLPGEGSESSTAPGGIAFVQYPLSFYHRASGAAGFIKRSISYPVFTTDGVGFVDMTDNIPFLSASFSGDTVVWQDYGPHAGHRYSLTTTYSQDLKESGMLSWDLELDARQYVPFSRRNELAFRLFAAYATGNRPDSVQWLKIGAKRDFIAIATPRSFLEAWEPWVQAALSASRHQLGPGWQQAFLTAPVWRFWLGAAICGTTVAGVPPVTSRARQLPRDRLASGQPAAIDFGTVRLLELTMGNGMVQRGKARFAGAPVPAAACPAGCRTVLYDEIP